MPIVIIHCGRLLVFHVIEMIAFKTIRKFKCPFALCVILSIAAVIGCDLLCDLGILSLSFPKPGQVVASVQQQDHHHDAKPGNNHSHHPHSHGPAAHGHDAESEDEDCCDDLTQKFYSSLANQSHSIKAFIQVELFKLIAAVSPEWISGAYAPCVVENTESWHLPNGPPEIKGQTIRILIRSFLI